ncbi:hypothetical protein RJG79_10730 [Mycoplasmatota bacterium WC44]
MRKLFIIALLLVAGCDVTDEESLNDYIVNMDSDETNDNEVINDIETKVEPKYYSIQNVKVIKDSITFRITEEEKSNYDTLSAKLFIEDELVGEILDIPVSSLLKRPSLGSFNRLKANNYRLEIYGTINDNLDLLDSEEINLNMYQGYKLWDKTIGGKRNELINLAIEDENGNIILVGSSTSSDLDIISNSHEFFKGVLDYRENGLILKLDSNGNKLWDITIGGKSIDELVNIIEDCDGNYVITGYTYSNNLIITSDDYLVNRNGKNHKDLLVFKITPQGNTIWAKTFGGTNNEEVYSIIQDSDGNYILAGAVSQVDLDISDGISNHIDGYVIKLDTNGKVIWDRTITDDVNERIFFIAQNSDSTYTLIGNSNKELDLGFLNDGLNTLNIISIDTNGNIINNISKPSDCDRIINDVAIDKDDNYVIVGLQYNEQSKIKEGYIQKINKTGDVVFDITYRNTNRVLIGGGFYNTFNSITVDKMGNYIIAGSSDSEFGDETDWDYFGKSKTITFKYTINGYIIKMTPDGNVIWDVILGGSMQDMFTDVLICGDGSLIVTGETNSNDIYITDGLSDHFNVVAQDPTAGHKDALIMKLFYSN